MVQLHKDLLRFHVHCIKPSPQPYIPSRSILQCRFRTLFCFLHVLRSIAHRFVRLPTLLTLHFSLLLPCIFQPSSSCLDNKCVDIHTFVSTFEEVQYNKTYLGRVLQSDGRHLHPRIGHLSIYQRGIHMPPVL